MDFVTLVSDTYDRQARLYPALILVTPGILTAAGILSLEAKTIHSLVVLFGGFGGAFLLTQLARDAGKKGEVHLFEQWGGMPSVAIFRHSDSRINAVMKQRLHKRLSLLVKGTKAPTELEEKTDPKAADDVYATWSSYLRNNTRDIKKYRLLFKENISYGYRRNTWGLRRLGIAVSFTSFVADCAYLQVMYKSTARLGSPIFAAAVLSFVMLLLWLFRFTANWVRIPADAYADRLVEASMQVGSSSKGPAKG